MKWAKKEQDVESSPKSVDGMCMCYGCIMPGSLNSSTSGPVNDWMCAAHFRADSGNWATITHRYRQHEQLVNLILTIRKSFHGQPFDIKGWLISLHNSGDAEYLPNDLDRRLDNSLSMRKWGVRLEKRLYELVTHGITNVVKDDGPSVSNSIEIMNLADLVLKEIGRR
jgi:hypothetical protein